MAKYDSLKTLAVSLSRTMQHTITYADHTFAREFHFPELPTPEQLYVRDVLGEGGMGVVYRGVQSHPEREVAIKRLKQQSSYMRLALYREAMITGALSHPTIIPIHSLNLVGEHAPEVVMKQIEGNTILELMSNMELGHDSSESTFSLRRLLNVLRQVCNGLEYAHSKGVIHRDIKPENIMVGPFGEVYILDWGIAVCDLKLPVFPNGLVGTPSYMAPEMIRGNPDDVDARTDVFLLGATLHHILTGEVRHQGDTLGDVLDAVSASAPFSYDAEVPEILASLVNQACHPNPDLRIQSPAQFRKRMEEYLEYQQAFTVYDAAQKELNVLKQLVGYKDPTKKQRHAIQRHYNRSRFGFEHALKIWPEFFMAKQKLDQTKIMMIEHHLAGKKLDAVLPMVDELDDLPQHLKVEVEALGVEQSTMQYELQQFREDQNRKQSSALFRISLLAGICSSCAVLLYYLFQINELDPNELSAKTLFFQSLTLGIPLIPVVLIGRDRFFVSANARQALISIVGILLAINLHRWVSIAAESVPSSIIVVDFFIAGLGFLNTTPSIRYGRHLGVLCFSIGTFGHLFPSISWPGTLIMAMTLGICVFFDWKRNWNEPKTPVHDLGGRNGSVEESAPAKPFP